MKEANAEVNKVKRLILIGICFLLFFSLKPAESYAQAEDTPFKKGYATTQDIILQIIKPNIEQILEERYGEDFVDWSYNNREIIDLKLVQDMSIPKWFEVTVSVVYKLKNTDGKAQVELKMIPPAFSQEKDITEIEIELLDLFLAERVD
ncbi:hypothetical protein [Virgibacillus ainsalahensis]